MNKIVNLTILFTYECPLECTYCNLRKDTSKKTMTFEEIDQQISNFISDNPDVLKQVCITGGEPFLYPNMIKKIVEKYGEQVMFLFYTSGYCFTDDILEFLSHYKVNFTLSVDGGEELTNYLRPVKVGESYFQRLKKNMPSLLYYFPNVTAKVIINHIYIDQIYKTYLSLEQIGFRKIYFTMDFTERNNNDEGAKHTEHKYTQEEKDLLQYQFMKIADQMIYGFRHNLRRCTIQNITRIGRVETDTSIDFEPENIFCGICNGAFMYDVSKRTLREGCFKKFNYSLKQYIEELRTKFNQNKTCPKDSNCGCWKYCCLSGCPTTNLENTGSLIDLEENQCVLNKICYNTLSYILGNMIDESDYTFEYIRFLSQMKGDD